jgi:glycosyltransferase involved in cell wall biosynthesis
MTEATASATEATASAEPVAQPSMYAIDARLTRYRSLFCSYIWPRHPGHSGGEIRDFHLLRRLLSISKVEFLVSHPSPPDERDNPLESYLEALHTPETIRMRPDLFSPDAFQRTLRSRAVTRLRLANIPVLGPRYHLDVANQFPNIKAYARDALQKALETRRPDFLFVSPQTNPVALLLDTTKVPTRMIMAAYDVEAVRMYRIAASCQGLRKAALELEARRAAHFERANLAHYDGVIAVSDLDRQIFIHDYGFAPKRVLTIENSVDSNYFAFVERQPIEQPQIAFVGSLTYLPNQQAAWRLIRQIMPLVRQRYPNASLWIVGQSPDAALLEESDGTRVVVTGKVDDVRPYLAHASLACVPLISGSGTKYKVLEALSAGVPMVCSPLAIEGLDIEVDKHVLVGQSDAELAAAIVRLLDDPDLAVNLARQGRELVERHYTWDVNLARLDDWLDEIIALPRRLNELQSDTLIHPATDGEAANLEQSGCDTVLTLNVTTTEGGKPHD